MCPSEMYQNAFVRSVDEVLKSGIEGYVLHLADYSGHPPEGVAAIEHGDGRWSLVVDKEAYQQVMQQVFAQGGRIESIEPQRKNLETLFLELPERPGHVGGVGDQDDGPDVLGREQRRALAGVLRRVAGFGREAHPRHVDAQLLDDDRRQSLRRLVHVQ